MFHWSISGGLESTTNDEQKIYDYLFDGLLTDCLLKYYKLGRVCFGNSLTYRLFIQYDVFYWISLLYTVITF